MMRRLGLMQAVAIVLGASSALAGCEPRPAWEMAPVTHRCSSEQMERVIGEARWCNDNTSFFDTYCYGAAIIRNCVRIAEDAR